MLPLPITDSEQVHTGRQGRLQVKYFLAAEIVPVHRFALKAFNAHVGMQSLLGQYYGKASF